MPSITTRQVDKLPNISPRPVEMQVLCLGFSRTATMSLYTALNKLGYISYHCREVGSTEAIKNKHILCWLEGLQAKLYGIGQPYGKEEFDKILGSYSAVTDAPCVNFSDGLLAAYPNAKVVLTTRDPDQWLESMERSYYEIFSWKSWGLIAAIDTAFIGRYNAMLKLVLTDWTTGQWNNRNALRAGFIAHNKHISSIVPKENLLEFTPDQGWGPLCEFLGKEVPDGPFPRINEGANTAALHKPLMYIRYATVILRAAIWPIAIGGLAWGVRWWSRGGTLEVVHYFEIARIVSELWYSNNFDSGHNNPPKANSQEDYYVFSAVLFLTRVSPFQADLADQLCLRASETLHPRNSANVVIKSYLMLVSHFESSKKLRLCVSYVFFLLRPSKVEKSCLWLINLESDCILTWELATMMASKVTTESTGRLFGRDLRRYLT